MMSDSVIGTSLGDEEFLASVLGIGAGIGDTLEVEQI